jgi:hypothetical protein
MLPSSSQEGRAGERRAMMTYDMLTFFFLRKKRKEKKTRASQAGSKARRRAGGQASRRARTASRANLKMFVGGRSGEVGQSWRFMYPWETSRTRNYKVEIL